MATLSRRKLLAGGAGTALSAMVGAQASAQGSAPVIRLPGDITRGDEATITRVNTSAHTVALTFDDGPHPRHTPPLLDMLKARGLRATFYVIGQNVVRYPQLMARMAAEGHEIGNHTWRHPFLTQLGTESVQRELDRTTIAVFETTGRAPVTMRPPYGALSSNQRKMVYQTRGLPTVLWSVDPRDWQRPGSQIVANRIVGGANNGAIILAHDIHGPTVRAMPATLDGLLARGFNFSTVSELLGWPRWDTRKFRMNTG